MAEEKGRLKLSAVMFRELEIAFDGGGEPIPAEWYLDRTTGKPESILEDDPESEAKRDRFERAASRYARIEPPDTEEEYAWMEEFADGVRDAKAQKDLRRAIEGEGAFKRFQDVLRRHSALRDEWAVFREERMRAALLAWLERSEIEAPASLPPLRSRA